MTTKMRKFIRSLNKFWFKYDSDPYNLPYGASYKTRKYFKWQKLFNILAIVFMITMLFLYIIK